MKVQKVEYYLKVYYIHSTYGIDFFSEWKYENQLVNWLIVFLKKKWNSKLFRPFDYPSQSCIKECGIIIVIIITIFYTF